MTMRLKKIRQVFLDMDGTIYHGRELFPTTEPFLRFLRDHGVGYAFLSNNSSWSKAEYVQRLAALGLTATAEDFYISTDYTIDWLRRFRPEIRRIFWLGMPAVIPEFTAAGFQVVDDAPEAVVVGFDRMLTYERLCRAAWWLRRGAPGFATHPDVFCPTDEATWLVDCGALTAALIAATGCAIQVLGKPDPGLLREAAARRQVPLTEVLMVGDRLATDIACGVNAGTMTAQIVGGAVNDLTLPPGITPDLRVADLGELQKIWQKAMEA